MGQFQVAEAGWFRKLNPDGWQHTHLQTRTTHAGVFGEVISWDRANRAVFTVLRVLNESKPESARAQT